MSKKYALAALAAVTMLMITGAALAPSRDQQTASSVQHCGVMAPAAANGEIEAESIACFDSAAELGAYAAEHFMLASRGAAASHVLGTLYKGKNRTGDSLTLWGNGKCIGATFGFSPLASGWATSVQSAQAIGECWVTLYSSTGYSGSKLNCTPTCNTLAGLSKNTRSVVFRPSGTLG